MEWCVSDVKILFVHKDIIGEINVYILDWNKERKIFINYPWIWACFRDMYCKHNVVNTSILLIYVAELYIRFVMLLYCMDIVLICKSLVAEAIL